MNSAITYQDLSFLVRSFGGPCGPLGDLHRKLDEEIWAKESGFCDWTRAWEDILSIFAEEFSKEDHQP